MRKLATSKQGIIRLAKSTSDMLVSTQNVKSCQSNYPLSVCNYDKLFLITLLLFFPYLNANEEIQKWIQEFSHSKKQPVAVEHIIAKGKEAIPFLLQEATKGESTISRGWALSCIAQIGDYSAMQGLKEISDDWRQPTIIRTWSIATQAHLAKSFQELCDLHNKAQNFSPALKPILQRAKILAKKSSISKLVTMSRKQPDQRALLDFVIMTREDQLIAVWLTDSDKLNRLRASRLLASINTSNNPQLKSKIIDQLKYKNSPNLPPWGEQTLYVPFMTWDKEEATQLIHNLLSWYLWAEINNLNKTKKQIWISFELEKAADCCLPYKKDNQLEGWLVGWAEHVGKAKVEAMLKEQGVFLRYQKMLDKVREKK